MTSIKSLLFYSYIFLSLFANAQDIKIKADSYSKANPTETFKMKSSIDNDREYIMHVTYAIDSVIQGKKYPVLYYTDAWTSVDYFNQLGNDFIYSNEIENLILVGISFETDEQGWIDLRKKDFLPNLTITDSTRTAGNFLNFISEELIPYVEQNYPADSSDRGIYGYSFGCLFSTYVLKKKPFLFNRMGIGSPSLWFKDFTLLKDEQLRVNISSITDLKVFVEYGTLESEKQKYGAEQLYDMILENDKIESKKFILDGSHISAFPATCVKALTYLYAKDE